MITKTKNIYDQLVFWISCMAYGFAFLYLCATYMPGSVLHFKFAIPHIVASLYPYKWDFYTGSASEPEYHMYTVQGNKLVRNDIQPFTIKFLFGLKRNGKVIASELENIITDTPFMATAIKYIVKTPLNSDLNNYIHADTIKYNNYHSENVRYLAGKMLLSVERYATWQERRGPYGVQHTVTLIPINLATP